MGFGGRPCRKHDVPQDPRPLFAVNRRAWGFVTVTPCESFSPRPRRTSICKHTRLDTTPRFTTHHTAMTSCTARGCVFFYGHSKGEHASFSQFFEATFQDDENNSYCCAEQFMMASKAMCMGDAATLAKIMACGYDPREIKALGRRVAPYDEAKWNQVREAVVARGNYLKFTQNKRLSKLLLSTQDLTLVEAAPNDHIWGIGISVQDAAKGAKWKGSNLLGKCLMHVREAIASDVKVPAVRFARPGDTEEPPRAKKQRSGDTAPSIAADPAHAASGEEKS